MPDTPPSRSATPVPPAEVVAPAESVAPVAPASLTPAEQARLRREARQKKILARGSDRLSRIKSTFTGEPVEAATEQSADQPPASATSAEQQTQTQTQTSPKPLELAEHFTEPAPRRRVSTRRRIVPVDDEREHQVRSPRHEADDGSRRLPSFANISASSPSSEFDSPALNDAESSPGSPENADVPLLARQFADLLGVNPGDAPGLNALLGQHQQPQRPRGRLERLKDTLITKAITSLAGVGPGSFDESAGTGSLFGGHQQSSQQHQPGTHVGGGRMSTPVRVLLLRRAATVVPIAFLVFLAIMREFRSDSYLMSGSDSGLVPDTVERFGNLRYAAPDTLLGGWANAAPVLWYFITLRLTFALAYFVYTARHGGAEAMVRPEGNIENALSGFLTPNSTQILRVARSSIRSVVDGLSFMLLFTAAVVLYSSVSTSSANDTIKP
ncbi:hypothetical protein GQ42DRAFT_90100 [Ramicandelaber brevisporus]|nr:hypothetical protein GQ42DRAFT_90100 [Ramicandelaber brevisporus]